MLLNFNELKMFTDENIDPEVIAFLRSKGFDVLDVKELSFHGKTDEFLLEFANNEDRIILTHDSDFGRLVFTKDMEFVGILYLRPGHFDSHFTIKSLKYLLEQNISVKVPFLITVENQINKIKIRIREI